MARKRFSAEQIIIKLREAEVLLVQGQSVGQVCHALEISEQTYLSQAQGIRRAEHRPGEEAQRV